MKLTIGLGVLVVVLAATLLRHDGRHGAAIRKTDARIALATKALDSLTKAHARDSARADSLAAIADGFRARLARVRDSGHVFTKAVSIDTSTPPVVLGDTTDAVTVHRVDDPKPYVVPKFLMDDRATLLGFVSVLDSAYVAEVRARRFLQDTLVPDYRRQLVAAGQVIRTQREAIEARDKVRLPKCRVVCGVVIGVVGVVGAAIVLR